MPSIEEQNNIESRVIPMTRLLRRRAVLELTGMGTTKLYELMKNNEFPRPVPISDGLVGWVDSEVQEWIDSRIALRDQAS